MVADGIDCGRSNVASRAKWAEKVAEGLILEAAEELVTEMHRGQRTACEQPRTALEWVVGPCTYKTNHAEHGEKKLKDVLWWLHGLPPVPASDPVPEELRVKWVSNVSAKDKEMRMLKRSPTPMSFATPHAHYWELWADQYDEGFTTKAEADKAKALSLALTRHNYTYFAANYAPVINELDAEKAYIVLLPIAQCGSETLLHVPKEGIFGVEVT